MHLRLVAVGDKQPAWVDSAFEEYTQRLPRQWQFTVTELATAQRTRGKDSTAAKEAESARILDTLRAADWVVLLDERGKDLGSRAFSDKLGDWQSGGRDICFIIGGPDGVSSNCRQRADFTLALSPMTLPHGLARVLFAEQLYRAWTLLQGHPYHRD